MRVATFQRFAIYDDAERTVDQLFCDLTWADENNVDIALFPESYLQGHSYDRALVERRALATSDPAFQTLIGKLGSIRAAAIIGFFERRGEQVFNSAMLLEAGTVAGVYAKANPTEEGCVPGSAFPVWKRAGKTFGILICGDLNRPEIAATLTSAGADLLFCPLNMMLRPHKADIWRAPSIQALSDCARDNGRWVISADVVGPNDQGWLSYGCTAAIRPDGTVSAKATELEEGVLLFDLA